MASRQLKVYGWLEWVKDCPPAANGNQQARVIVAASSWTEAIRLARAENSANYIRTQGSTTLNEVEIAVAMAQPRVALWSADRTGPSPEGWHVLWPQLPIVTAYGTGTVEAALSPDLDNLGFRDVTPADAPEGYEP